jgi:hypothetical protein
MQLEPMRRSLDFLPMSDRRHLKQRTIRMLGPFPLNRFSNFLELFPSQPVNEIGLDELITASVNATLSRRSIDLIDQHREMAGAPPFFFRAGEPISERVGLVARVLEEGILSAELENVLQPIGRSDQWSGFQEWAFVARLPHVRHFRSSPIGAASCCSGRRSQSGA